MPDKPMIPGEETTAGAIRQSLDTVEFAARLQAVADAARADWTDARKTCGFRQERGYCHDYRVRDRRCPDCPTEWFDRLPAALAALEEAVVDAS